MKRTHEFLALPAVFDPDVWLAALVENGEWEVLDIRLDLHVVEFTADESLGVENPAKETAKTSDDDSGQRARRTC
jgi:hypothetical protein